SAQVTLDDVELDSSWIVTRPEDRISPDEQLDLALVLQCADSIGALDVVFERTLTYAKERFAFGRPIGSYQAIKHRLASMKTSLEAAAAASTAAARAVAIGSTDASLVASCAKAFISDCGPRLIQDAVQIHGGIGLTWEHDLHLYLRRVSANAAT